MKLYSLSISYTYRIILSVFLSVHFSAVSVEQIETVPDKYSITSIFKNFFTNLSRTKKEDTSVSQTEVQTVKKDKTFTNGFKEL